ncbi:hypothetical protein [Vibrio phage VP16C]|nr:hypothetical protein [Vibrio phage VP16C]
MIADKYGVGTVLFENEDKPHPCAQFGDGKLRIFTTVWSPRNVGLKIARTVEDLPPFSAHTYDEENPPHQTDGNEIHLLFDDPRSIDAMITQLEYIKGVMLGGE